MSLKLKSMTQIVQSGQSISLWESLTTLRCGVCNILFAMPDSMLRDRKNDGEWFYCPNGHHIHYYDSETSQLKKQVAILESQKSNLNQVISDKNNQIEQLGYSVRAQKAAKTKILNRVKNGVCPCCNRTFQDLQKHFKSKHPELLK